MAEHYFATGRAEWVGNDLRLILSHPSNQAAKLRDALGYEAADWSKRRITPDELLHIGVVCPAKAIRENLTDRSVRSGRHVAGGSGPVRITMLPVK